MQIFILTPWPRKSSVISSDLTSFTWVSSLSGSYLHIQAFFFFTLQFQNWDLQAASGPVFFWMYIVLISLTRWSDRLNNTHSHVTDHCKRIRKQFKTWLKFCSIILIFKIVSQKMLSKVPSCSLQVGSSISFCSDQLSSLHVYTSNTFIQNRLINVFHKCIQLLKWISYDSEYILCFTIFCVAILLIIHLLSGSWQITALSFLNLFLTFLEGQLSPPSIMAFVKQKSQFQLWLFLTKG